MDGIFRVSVLKIDDLQSVMALCRDGSFCCAAAFREHEELKERSSLFAYRGFIAGDDNWHPSLMDVLCVFEPIKLRKISARSFLSILSAFACGSSILGQNACDSLIIDGINHNASNDSILHVHVANSSSRIFFYHSFRVLDKHGDKLASEVANFFGIGNSSVHDLGIQLSTTWPSGSTFIYRVASVSIGMQLEPHGNPLSGGQLHAGGRCHGQPMVA